MIDSFWVFFYLLLLQPKVVVEVVTNKQKNQIVIFHCHVHRCLFLLFGRNLQYFKHLAMDTAGGCRLNCTEFFCQITFFLYRFEYCWCCLWYRRASLVANWGTFLWDLLLPKNVSNVPRNTVCLPEKHYLRACSGIFWRFECITV